MRVISRRTLRDFWESAPKYIDSKEPLEAWFSEAKKAQWSSPQAIKEQYRSASILKNNRVVFNIKGNDYRLVVKINYPYQTIFIRFVGTHKQYDKTDIETA